MRRNLREKGESAMRMKWWALAAAAGILACGRVSIGLKAQDCASLKNVAIDQTKVESAEVVPAGSTISMPMGIPGSQIGPLPAFCKVTGVIHDHVAADGKHYGIRFELRLRLERQVLFSRRRRDRRQSLAGHRHDRIW
jgi:hypothetical protein